jgi:hypothetical protein
MKATTRVIRLAILGAGLIAGVIVLAMWLTGGSDGAVRANSVTPITVGFDMNTAGNSCPHNGSNCTLGTINNCVEVATGGGAITVDVFLDGLPDLGALQPDDGGITSFQYHIGEKTGKTVGTLTAYTHTDNTINLLMQEPTVSPQEYSDGTGTSIPCWDASFADLGDVEYNGYAGQAYTKGVLSRLTIDTTGRPDGYYYLTIDAPGTAYGLIVGDALSDDYCQAGSPVYTGCDILDGNATPIPHGIIAIGVACPSFADLAKEAFAPGNFDLDDNGSYEASYTPGLDIPVSQQVWFQVNETVQNNGPYVGPPPPQALVTVACTPPESIITPGTAGGECSYRVPAVVSPLAAVPTVTVDGTPLTCDHTSPPPGVTCSSDCTAGVCPVGTEIKVQWPLVLDVHKQTIGLALDTPVPLPTEEWDVHCYEPSTHVWHFTNDIEPLDPTIIDPYDTNDHKEFDLSLDCIATADLTVSDAVVAAPDSAGQGATFQVNVSATATNTGPYTPVSGQVTFNLTVPGGCTKDPATSQVVTVPALGSASAGAVWNVHCTTTGTKTFGGNAAIALSPGQPHINDPTGNNGPITATEDSTEITATADARIFSWVFPDELKPPAATGPAETGDECTNAVDDDGDTVVNDGCPDIAGNQVLVVPTVAEDMDSTETLNNVPGAPHTTYTGTSIGVDIDVTETPDANCTAIKAGGNPDSATLLVNGTNWVDHHIWSVNLTSGDSCTIDFHKDITINTPGVNEYYDTDNHASPSVDLVADSDQDGVPDDYDGLNDNCDDVANPDQKDNDGDGLGDVCDPDDDNDGICDPGQSDISCTGSDNCQMIANPLQEDADVDTIGDVCELDVDCSGGGPDITDAVAILQYILGRVNPSPTCPPPLHTINAPRASAYVAYDAAHPELVGKITDAIMVLQCILASPSHPDRYNIVCPAPED